MSQFSRRPSPLPWRKSLRPFPTQNQPRVVCYGKVWQQKKILQRKPTTAEADEPVNLPSITSPDSKENYSSWMGEVKPEDTIQSPEDLDSLLLKWPHLKLQDWNVGEDTVSVDQEKSLTLSSPIHTTTGAPSDSSSLQPLSTSQTIYNTPTYPTLLPSTSISLPLPRSSSATPPYGTLPITSTALTFSPSPPQFFALSSTPPPLPPSPSPPPMLPTSSTPPPLLPSSTSPSFLHTSSTPPPFLPSSSTPPPFPQPSSIPPQISPSTSTQPPLFRSLSTPPPFPPSPSPPPTFATPSSTPPPFIPPSTTPPPLFTSSSNVPLLLSSFPTLPPLHPSSDTGNAHHLPFRHALPSSDAPPVTSSPSSLTKPFSLPSLPLRTEFSATCDTVSTTTIKSRDRASLSLKWDWLPEEARIHKVTKSGSSPSSLLGSPDGAPSRTLGESHLPSSPPKVSPNLAPRRHSERALRIIQENSEILQRMLRQPPPSSPSSPTTSYPSLPERFHTLEGDVLRSLSLEGGERSPHSPVSPASSSWPLDTSTDVSASASSKSPATSPVALGDVVSWGVRKGTLGVTAGGKLPSPTMASPPQTFNPFPQRASWRQPKELGVKLGLYSAASSPSPPVATTRSSPTTPTSPSRSTTTHPKQTFK